MRPLVLALTAVAALSALSACGSASKDADAGGDASATTDAVLGGRWELVFYGKDFDFPNGDPALAARGGKAHFLYRQKTGVSTYLVFDKAGGQQEIAFPQGTKDPGRVTVLPDGASVVVLQRLFDGALSAFRPQGGVATALAAPAGPTTSMHRVELVTLGDAAVLATVAGGATPTVVVQRLGAAGWEALGQHTAASTISRIRLAAGGARLALAILAGTSDRTVRSWEAGAWRELSGLPAPSGASALLSLVVDGARTWLLEWQEGAQQSVLWLHDGASWSEHVRSVKGEAFHGLVLHGGALYTAFAKSPNLGEAVATFGLARLDRGGYAKGTPEIPDGARFHAMDYEESYLVSDGDLWLAYREGAAGAGSTRVLRLVPR